MQGCQCYGGNQIETLTGWWRKEEHSAGEGRIHQGTAWRDTAVKVGILPGTARWDSAGEGMLRHGTAWRDMAVEAHGLRGTAR